MRIRPYVPFIDSDSGKRKYISREIAEVFREYYVSLYNLPTNLSTEQMAQKRQLVREYISSSGLPSISEDAAELINAPISSEEYMRAIKMLKPHKAPGPGPDGYTTAYYRAFASCLAPRFIKAFNYILEGRPIPIDTLRAHITVIPKEGKDHAHFMNYRPISLLNVDLKLFTRILASRLQCHLQDIIHPD